MELSKEVDGLLDLEISRVNLLTTTPEHTVRDKLKTNHISGKEICARIAEKLKQQLEFRHDIPCDTSTRHEGMGYSREAITKHVHDALRVELENAASVLESFRVKPPKKRQEARIEILDAMIVD